MKRLCVFLLCMLIVSCTSTPERETATPFGEVTLANTKPPTETVTLTPTLTPTITPTPTPKPIIVGDKSGAISFLEGSSFTGYQIKIIGLDGTNVKVFDKSWGKIWDYEWSPNNQYLAYLANKTRLHEKELYILESDTSNVKKLTSGLDIVDFAWSPESDKLVFSNVTGTEGDSKSYIWVASIDGSLSPQKIPLDIKSNLINNLAWSSSGERISFASRTYSGNILYIAQYIVSADGTNLEELKTNGRSINWMPNENKIGLASSYSISVQDISTREVNDLINLPQNGAWIVDNFSWSPEGKQVAYRVSEINYTERPNSSIHIYSIDSAEDRQIIDVTKNYDNIVWSPDGTQLGFTNCEEFCSIYRVDIDSGIIVEIIANLEPKVTHLKWTSPITLYPSVIPPTSTPIAPWNLLPTPPLYDDFEKAPINPNLWNVVDTNSLKYYSCEQENGVLIISSNGEIQSQDFGLQLGLYPRSIKQMGVFEANVKIDSKSNGSFAFLKTAITAENGSFTWATQCRLGNSLKKPTFLCDIANTEKGYGIVYTTKEVPIKFDQWYVIRIEIQAENGALQYYLDDTLLDTYVPDDAEKLIDPLTKFMPRVGIWTSSGSIISYVDDVRITK